MPGEDCVVKDAKVLKDFHTLNSGLDHRPIIMTLQWRARPILNPAEKRALASHKPPKLLFDPQDEAGIASFNAILASSQLPTWETSNDLHEAAFDSAISYAAKEAFQPPCTRVKKDPILTEATFAWIVHKSEVKSWSRRLNRYVTSVRLLFDDQHKQTLVTLRAMKDNVGQYIKSLKKHIKYLAKENLTQSCIDCAKQTKAASGKDKSRVAWQHTRALLARGGS